MLFVADVGNARSCLYWQFAEALSFGLASFLSSSGCRVTLFEVLPDPGSELARVRMHEMESLCSSIVFNTKQEMCLLVEAYKFEGVASRCSGLAHGRMNALLTVMRNLHALQRVKP
jgi:hypothetical protein